MLRAAFGLILPLSLACSLLAVDPPAKSEKPAPAPAAAKTPAVVEAKKISALLVTGDDVTPAHNWQEVSLAIRKALLDSGRFEVRISEDAAILESTNALSRYDVVVLHLYNAKTPTLLPGAKQNLLDFVGGGKGLVVSHLSSASFKEWDDFEKLCGRRWVMGKSGHNPRNTFKAKIKQPNHPITEGLGEFEADDELYAGLQGETIPIQVLVEADSDWSKKTEPLVFTVDYGKGRIFHETFGHDGKAINNPNVTLLIQRGAEWAATGNVRKP